MFSVTRLSYNRLMAEASYLTNQFLIALPGMGDGNFSRTVTYICQHSEHEGAMGIVLNRPSELQLCDVFNHMDIQQQNTSIAGQTVYIGGPVQEERGFVLHTPPANWDSSMPVSEQISVTTSRDVLQAMAQGKGPEETFVALGYAGWGPGQLEQELHQDTWLSGPADADIIFKLPSDQRWEAAAAVLGVDLNLINTAAGHA